MTFRRSKLLQQRQVPEVVLGGFDGGLQDEGHLPQFGPVHQGPEPFPADVARTYMLVPVKAGAEGPPGIIGVNHAELA